MQSTQTPSAKAPAQLTPRQIEALQMASQGLSQKQIAASMLVKTRTVKAFLDQAKERLRADNCVHAVSQALRYHLIS